MKLSSQDAFEKNLRQSAPDHFSRVYGAVIGDRYERLFFAERVFNFLKHYKPHLVKQVIRVDAGDSLILESDLFTIDERFVIVDQVEKIKKADQQLFIEQIENSDAKKVFLLLGESLSSDLYQALKSDIVLLDLSQEKPWDKKKRLINELFKMTVREKKTIDPAAIDLLVDSVGLDFARLRSELEKLFVFAEGKNKIEVSDVRQMTLPTKEKSYWQMARDLLFGGTVDKGRIKDLSDWLIFAGQLRNQLMTMIRICEALERKEIPQIEGIREKELAQLIEKCDEYSLSDFLEVVHLLFEFEIEAKEEGIKADHLVDRIVLALAKRGAALR